MGWYSLYLCEGPWYSELSLSFLSELGALWELVLGLLISVSVEHSLVLACGVSERTRVGGGEVMVG